MFKVNKRFVYNKVKVFNHFNNFYKNLIQSAQIGRESYYRDLLIRHNILPKGRRCKKCNNPCRFVCIVN